VSTLSAFGPNSYRQPKSLLINCLVNDRLLDAWSAVHQTLLQLTDITQGCSQSRSYTTAKIPWFTRLKSWMLGCLSFGCLLWWRSASRVSRRRNLDSALCCLNLTWFFVSDSTLCSKKVTPKFKSLRHILSELNILLAALIIIFPT